MRTISRTKIKVNTLFFFIFDHVVVVLKAAEDNGPCQNQGQDFVAAVAAVVVVAVVVVVVVIVTAVEDNWLRQN